MVFLWQAAPAAYAGSLELREEGRPQPAVSAVETSLRSAGVTARPVLSVPSRSPLRPVSTITLSGTVTSTSTSTSTSVSTAIRAASRSEARKEEPAAITDVSRNPQTETATRSVVPSRPAVILSGGRTSPVRPMGGGVPSLASAEIVNTRYKVEPGTGKLVLELTVEIKGAVEKVDILSTTDIAGGNWVLEQRIYSPAEGTFIWTQEIDVTKPAKFFKAQVYELTTVPVLPSLVTVRAQDRRLFIQERNQDGTLAPVSAYTIQGVNWTGMKPEWIDKDIELLKELGANTVRITAVPAAEERAAFIRILDKLYRAGIKVILQVQADSAFVQNGFAVIKAYKDHPALLLWEVAELNGSDFKDNFIQEIKKIDVSHPVSLEVDNIVFDEGTQDGPRSMKAYTDAFPSADLFALHGMMTSFRDYENNTVSQAYSGWTIATDKPLYMADFYRPEQWTTDIYWELSKEREQGRLVGGLFVNWAVDSWGGERLIQIGADSRLTTDHYTNLQKMFKREVTQEVKATPALKIRSEQGARFSLDDTLFFDRQGFGGGGRGINVAVIDTHTGVRLTHMINFDTWGNRALFEDLVNFVNSLPNGSLIAFAVGDEGSLGATEAFYQVLESLGSEQVRDVEFRDSWIFVAEKGGRVLAEAWGNYINLVGYTPVEVTVKLNLTVDPNFGIRTAQPVQAPEKPAVVRPAPTNVRTRQEVRRPSSILPVRRVVDEEETRVPIAPRPIRPRPN